MNMNTQKIIYRWTPGENYKSHPGGIAEEYAVEADESGSVVWARYGDIWSANPSTAPLIQHLIENQSKYWEQVNHFNVMYKLDCPEKPVAPTDETLEQFKSIISEEIEEVEDIKKLTDPLERIVAMADWLGDLIVYCSTKGKTLGLPMPAILDIIMQSNFSKLDTDGKPIYDERGKVMKGVNYWKPEPKLLELLR